MTTPTLPAHWTPELKAAYLDVRTIPGIVFFGSLTTGKAVPFDIDCALTDPGETALTQLMRVRARHGYLVDGFVATKEMLRCFLPDSPFFTRARNARSLRKAISSGLTPQQLEERFDQQENPL